MVILTSFFSHILINFPFICFMFCFFFFFSILLFLRFLNVDCHWTLCFSNVCVNRLHFGDNADLLMLTRTAQHSWSMLTRLFIEFVDRLCTVDDRSIAWFEKGIYACMQNIWLCNLQSILIGISVVKCDQHWLVG